jgi:glycosyltransferase involved in cell wall biosynthesis
MHIAFWSPAWPLERHPNGIITYVHAVKLELEKRGHRVSVFTENLDDLGSAATALRIERSRWNRLMNRLSRKDEERMAFDFSSTIAAAILREHRRNPIDIIEMEESFGWCADVQRRTSLPVVVKLHGPAFLTLVDPERSTPFGREKIEREGRALSLCGTIISPSEANLKRTVQRYGLVNKDTRIIVNPVVISESAPVWALDACDRKTILFVGRFDLIKGADVILRAFSCVLNSIPDAKLVFVGPDNGWVTAEGQRVQFASYCQSVLPPETSSRIEFRGRLPHGDVAALRAKAMVTVVASRWESQPYAMLEAMAQGCPIVATDAGACPESIVHERNGLLARSENPEDFALQLCAVLRDPQAAAAMGRAAREYVVKHHSAAAVVDALLECYASVIAAHKSTTRARFATG